MFNYIKIALVYGMTFYLISSCSEELINNGDEPVIPSFNKNSFPLNVGNWWRYRVHNYNCWDTLRVRIISSSQSFEEKKYLCVIDYFRSKYPSGFKTVDTAMLTYNDTLISFKYLKEDGYWYFPEFILKLPFHVGDSWTGDITPNDTFKVVSYITYKPNSLIDSAYNLFYIKRIATSKQFSNVETLQVADNIGIVISTIAIYWLTTGQQLQQFYLMDYELK